MRLLDAEALIYDDVAELAHFPDDSCAPRYAILSHTWELEEVLFRDIPLGPQHEIQPTVASLRALRRQQAMCSKDSLTSISETSGSYSSDENSDEDKAVHSTVEAISEDRHSNLIDQIDEDGTTSSPPAVTSEANSPTSASSASSKLSKCTRASIDAACEPMSRSRMPHVKVGWNKTLNACLQTLRDGLTYIWIDTCCIDKSSSAELSEAINSMYRWYQSSKVCYAYLSDCQWDPNRDKPSSNSSRLLGETDSEFEFSLNPRPASIFDPLAIGRCIQNSHLWPSGYEIINCFVGIGFNVPTIGNGHQEEQWQFIEAYPPLSNTYGPRIELLCSRIGFGAVAIQAWHQQEDFVIVVGVVGSSAPIQPSFSENDGLCCYWILPALEIYLRKVDHIKHAYMKFLCQRAVSFQSKEYFENTMKRQQSCKTFQVSPSEVLSARFVKGGGPFKYQTLDLNLEHKAETTDSWVGYDYFELEDIYRTLDPRLSFLRARIVLSDSGSDVS